MEHSQLEPQFNQDSLFDNLLANIHFQHVAHYARHAFSFDSSKQLCMV